MTEIEMTIVYTFPNGLSIYRKSNGVGGHTYFSDEIGGGVFVWDTCLVSEQTLRKVLELEAERWEAANERE